MEDFTLKLGRAVGNGVAWAVDRSIRLAGVYAAIKLLGWIGGPAKSPMPDLDRPLYEMTVREGGGLLLAVAIFTVVLAAVLWPERHPET